MPGGRFLTRAQAASRQVVEKKLPIFYGKPEDWSQFEKRYTESAVLCGFSDGGNLDILSKCLRGTARDAVSDLLADSESVPEIIEALKMLFGRSESAIKTMLQKIGQQPNPKADNLNTMVTFSLEIKNLSKRLEREGMRQYLSNSVLIQELVDKLPTIHKIDWTR